MKNGTTKRKRAFKGNGRKRGNPDIAAIGRKYREARGVAVGSDVGSAQADDGTPIIVGSGESELAGASPITGDRASTIGGSDAGLDGDHSGGGGRGGGNGRGSGSGRVADHARAGAGVEDARGRADTRTGILGETLRPGERDVNGDEPKPRRRRQSRQQKEVVSKQAEMASSAAMLGMALNAGFYAVSLSRGTHWMLQKDETFALSNSLTVAINASFPESWLQVYDDVLQKYAPWIAVVVTAGSIVNKRFEYDKLIAQRKFSEGSPGEHNGQDAALDN